MAESGIIANLWKIPEKRAEMHRPMLHRRLKGAIARRDSKARPSPLDNLALLAFGEKPNLLAPLPPRDPGPETTFYPVWLCLRENPDGLTADELQKLLAMREYGGNSVRGAIDNLRAVNGYRQPILNEDGRFRLLQDHEWQLPETQT
ncbi:hypothetical protein [Marichromatium sp. AB32]|uniref:hypothetical protein n=1 Tax=Marichromatium sp. AB32 TaxID=2483363 RepID=UPI0011CE5E80|nr:hypothetical protein [Marichromatium sp. AB32]